MPEKDREAKGDRMLWEDTTLSRHSEIERNCEIGPATAFGGEVGGRGGRTWWIWAVGCNRPNACKRLIEVSLPLCLPLRLRSSRKISVLEPER